MEIWSKLDGQGASAFSGGVVTIGNFDGLHLGHQSLLRQAEKVGKPRILMTFDPHPMQVLNPERHLKRLFPREDLFEQLPRYGVDLLLILPFDREFAKTSALDFLNRYVGETFHPQHIVAGYDFAFGNNRAGTLDLLKTWVAETGSQLTIMNPLRVGAEVVSSRRIRDLILKGDVHGASLLLNRPFYLRGLIVRGAGRGSQIGIPTLNQAVINETIPPSGVYVTKTSAEGQTYFSVTNIGVNPTFESSTALKVETHLLDATVELRDKSVDVHFYERLREERKFSSVAELQKQIASDIAKARAILEKVAK